MSWNEAKSCELLTLRQTLTTEMERSVEKEKAIWREGEEQRLKSKVETELALAKMDWSKVGTFHWLAFDWFISSLKERHLIGQPKSLLYNSIVQFFHYISTLILFLGSTETSQRSGRIRCQHGGEGVAGEIWKGGS